MAQANIKIAYLTQVPGGVWRCRPKKISEWVLRRKVLQLRPWTGKNKNVVQDRLRSLGASRISNLNPDHYETFYKFLLTLE